VSNEKIIVKEHLAQTRDLPLHSQTALPCTPPLPLSITALMDAARQQPNKERHHNTTPNGTTT
jgi:hypothetical protein